jgi:hypothetical protein
MAEDYALICLVLALVLFVLGIICGTAPMFAVLLCWLGAFCLMVTAAGCWIYHHWKRTKPVV